MPTIRPAPIIKPMTAPTSAVLLVLFPMYAPINVNGTPKEPKQKDTTKPNVGVCAHKAKITAGIIPTKIPISDQFGKVFLSILSCSITCSESV
jgi:hypothetical protein